MPRKTSPYLTNKFLLTETIKSQQNNKCTEALGSAFLLLVNKIGNKGNFCRYTYLDEMKGEAVVQLCSSWNKFNPQKSDNPFSFYTQITINAFLQVLNKEDKNHYIRDCEMVFQGLEPSFNHTERSKKYTENKKQLSEEQRRNYKKYYWKKKLKDDPEALAAKIRAIDNGEVETRPYRLNLTPEQKKERTRIYNKKSDWARRYGKDSEIYKQKVKQLEAGEPVIGSKPTTRVKPKKYNAKQTRKRNCVGYQAERRQIIGNKHSKYCYYKNKLKNHPNKEEILASHWEIINKKK